MKGKGTPATPKLPTKAQAIKANERVPKKGALTSRVRTYRFKPSKFSQSRLDDHERMNPYAPTPRPPTALDAFTAALDAEERPYAEQFFQMECPHRDRNLTSYKPATVREARTPLWYDCPDCKRTIRWWGTETATKQAEWMEHRPPEIDMETWGQWFTKDRSLWRFIFIEAKEEANGSD